MLARNYLDTKTAQIAKWVRGGVSPEALIRFAVQDMQLNPKLRECTPESVYIALLACASTGLEPGALKQEAFLVPYGRKREDGVWIQEAKFMAGWRGLQKQALRAGCKMLASKVVYANDHFELDLGTANNIVHRPALANPGDPVGAYAWARLPSGDVQIEWVSIDDLEKIKHHATKQKPSPAWQEWPDEMRRKSAIRRLAKHLPMGDDYYNGLRYERALEGHDENGATDIEVIDIITDGDATRDASRQLAESAAFSKAPEPVKAEPAKPNGKASKPAASKPAIDTQATERPTSAGSSPTSPAPSTSGTPAPNAASTSSSATSSAASTASPPAPASTTSSAGVQSPAASPATPASSSSSSSTTAPSESPAASTSDPTTSDGGAFGAPDDVDISFDTSSFGEDPVDSEPATPAPQDPPPFGSPTQAQVDAVVAWAKTAAPDQVKASHARWLEAFKVWVASCTTKLQLNAGKDMWLAWAAANFKGPKRASGGQPAHPGDPETIVMGNTFATQYKAVP